MTPHPPNTATAARAGQGRRQLACRRLSYAVHELNTAAGMQSHGAL
jgi:hypothetical protein